MPFLRHLRSFSTRFLQLSLRVIPAHRKTLENPKFSGVRPAWTYLPLQTLESPGFSGVWPVWTVHTGQTS